MRKGTLVKLKEVDEPAHPDNIAEGRTVEGYVIYEPTVDHRCLVANKGATNGLSTSVVQEILEEKGNEITFRTHNSIYKLTYADEE